MKILVSVATKHGATGEIGKVIAEQLRAVGHDVVELPPERVMDLGDVGGVVLGSAVYAGRWLKPARDLAARLDGGLDGRRVWLFSSGPLGGLPKSEHDAVDVASAIQQTGAREHRVFAGRLDRASLGLAERAIARVVKAPEGDFRDWAEVRQWAIQIGSQLTSTAT